MKVAKTLPHTKVCPGDVISAIAAVPGAGRGYARDSPFELFVTQACFFVLEFFPTTHSMLAMSVRTCTVHVSQVTQVEGTSRRVCSIPGTCGSGGSGATLLGAHPRRCSPPKGSPPNTISWGRSAYDFLGNTSIRSIAKIFPRKQLRRR